MFFHTCPVEPNIQALFRKATLNPGAQRIPISERAELARKTAIAPGTSSIQFGDEPFSIGSNRFLLTNESRLADASMFEKAVSHFGPVFDNAFVYLWAEDLREGIPRFTIKAFDLRQKTLPPQRDSSRGVLGRIEFNLDSRNKQMVLCTLRSSRGGCGGKMVVAAYNVAKELQMSAIVFAVHKMKAMRFYFHMDFGRPTMNNRNWWEVSLAPRER